MAVHNRDVAAILEETADLLAIEGANQFRVRAYQNAAQTVSDATELMDLSGLGAKRVGVLYKELGVESIGDLDIVVSCGDSAQVMDKSYGAALYCFTGSKAHNLAVRRIANDHGWKLNEYGLFDGDDRIAGRTAEEIFKPTPPRPTGSTPSKRW